MSATTRDLVFGPVVDIYRVMAKIHVLPLDQDIVQNNEVGVAMFDLPDFNTGL